MSVYDIADHPDFRFRTTDIVIRIGNTEDGAPHKEDEVGRPALPLQYLSVPPGGLRVRRSLPCPLQGPPAVRTASSELLHGLFLRGAQPRAQCREGGGRCRRSTGEAWGGGSELGPREQVGTWQRGQADSGQRRKGDQSPKAGASSGERPEGRAQYSRWSLAGTHIASILTAVPLPSPLESCPSDPVLFALQPSVGQVARVDVSSKVEVVWADNSKTIILPQVRLLGAHGSAPDSGSQAEGSGLSGEGIFSCEAGSWGKEEQC